MGAADGRRTAATPGLGIRARAARVDSDRAEPPRASPRRAVPGARAARPPAEARAPPASTRGSGCGSGSPGWAPAAPQAPALDPLFRVIRANHPKADLHLIERAYRTAERCHRGQLRKSGDAYITHPLAVTTILAELGMNETTLCAALLHDTVEDTSYTLRELTPRLRRGGRPPGRRLHQARQGQVRRVGQVRDHPQDDRGDGQDIRVLVIKLADRLHNMRTLHYLRPDKQSRIATETLEIFAPLAHRLGMNAIKWELEDLSFATLHPKVYDEIVRLVAEAAPEPGRVPVPDHRAGPGRPAGRQDQGHGHRPAEALLLDLPEDDRPRPRLRRHLRPASGCASWSRPTATATPPSA